MARVECKHSGSRLALFWLHTCLSLPSSPFHFQHAAKQAAAAATQTIAAAQHAATTNKNPSAQQQLVQSCKVSGRQSGLDLSPVGPRQTRGVWVVFSAPPL